MTLLARIRRDAHWALIIYPMVGLLGGMVILGLVAVTTIPRNSPAGFVPLALIVTLIGGLFGALVGFVGGLVELIALQRSFARGRRLAGLAIATFASTALLYLLAFSLTISPAGLLTAVAVATTSSLGFTIFGWAFWQRATPDSNVTS